MTNAGFEIIIAETFNAKEGLGIAMGRRESKYAPEGFEYVTWEYRDEDNRRNYFWGHYTMSGTDAVEDYHDRLSTEYRRLGNSHRL